MARSDKVKDKQETLRRREVRNLKAGKVGK